ncbi:MAG: corrinoid protein [Candidatus Hydrothermarchaeota archaeon]
MADKEDLKKKIADAVVHWEDEKVKEYCNEWIKAGFDAKEGIFDGLAAGMKVVGDLFDKQEYFVPEVLMCADALYGGLDILKPHVKQVKGNIKGSVVTGVVEGDVHDIGKNIVKLMYEIAGFTVYDLGKDVPLDKFVDEQLKTDSQLVSLSAMMTTTMGGMKVVIDKIKARNPKCKILIGGAPVTEKTAELYGADATAKDATNALKEALRMVEALRTEKIV